MSLPEAPGNMKSMGPHIFCCINRSCILTGLVYFDYDWGLLKCSYKHEYIMVLTSKHQLMGWC